ncbi:ribbon-helix-helix protein, CopG family [Sphingobacterium sp. MYb382]|uniref:ribbon-helix-helix protein, CopG family n=1 Tax=Sphingobacterium sp. MYb382 TaxID=2745278 RepID=UPI00309B2D27
MNTIAIKKSTSLRLDKDLYACIEKMVKKENRSVNNFIETVLANAIGFYAPNKETEKAINVAQEERSALKRF